MYLPKILNLWLNNQLEMQAGTFVLLEPSPDFV